MNRTEETRVSAVNASFYKNVFLLTQTVPPSLEFRQHFKKGMFDRPNTAGFLHVSHYLSVVYDAKLFKRMVGWPILCKRDEVAYRAEIKGFFSLLSRDNPDVNFPPILISHLVHATGVKFMIIMWRVSQLALRAYIKKQLPEKLLSAPRASRVDDLAVRYFDNTIATRRSVARETHERAKRILATANDCLEREIELSRVYKSQIFDGKECVRGLVSRAPFEPSIRERLTDVEDTDVVDVCKRNARERLEHLRGGYAELSELDESCGRLCKLVLRLRSSAGTLDTDEFLGIGSDGRRLLRARSETRRSTRANDGAVPFVDLLSLLGLASARMLCHVCATEDRPPPPCSSVEYIRRACEGLEALRGLYVALDTRLRGMLADERRVSRETASDRMDADDASVVAGNVGGHVSSLLRSPRIDFSLDCCVDDRLFYEKLCPPLRTEGEYKRLFRRHKRKYRNLSSDLGDSTWSDRSWGWSSPSAHSPKREQVVPSGGSISPLYSRLLRQSRTKRSRENISRSPSLSREGSRPSKRRCSIPEGGERDPLDTTPLYLLCSDTEN